MQPNTAKKELPQSLKLIMTALFPVKQGGHMRQVKQIHVFNSIVKNNIFYIGEPVVK